MSGTQVHSARLDPEPVAQVASRTSASPAPESLEMLSVQRLLGNRVVSGMLASGQAGPVGPASAVLQRAAIAGSGNRALTAAAQLIVEGAQVSAPGGDREREAQRAASRASRVPAADPGSYPAPAMASTRGGGVPLPYADRERLEPYFGLDLGGVRIHTDPAAHVAAAQLGARAFTRGADVYFGAGHFQPGTSAGRRLIGHEVAHVVQQGPPGIVQRQTEEDQPWYEEAGEWALGAIGGEWMDEQSFGQIGVDFVLSVVPVVDQVADARDLTAHVYRLGFKGEHAQWTRWLGLVFTLIGLIPELGSVIKSASKAVMKGARELLSHADDLIRLARRFLPDIGDLRRVEDLISSNWNRAVEVGTRAWETLLARGSALAARIPQLWRATRERVVGVFHRLRELSGSYLGPAFDRVRATISNTFAQVRAKLGFGPPKPKPIAGAVEVPMSQAGYERALGHVFPSQALRPLLSTVEGVGQAGAQRAVNNPAFVQACQNGNWALAGTFFHSAAAHEARNLPPGALPTGWTIDAERTIQSGAGGSRLDILARGPNGELVEIDWKTTGRSAISKASRDEMVKHAGQVTANIGGQLASQTSKSWVDFVRPLLPGINWPH